MDDDLVLDGNAIADLLAELFGGHDMTTTLRRCGSCGQRHALGEHRLYRGAGLVLRCPGCGDVALTAVARVGGGRELRFTGSWSL